MWIKAKMKAGEGDGKRSKKREISKEERYATPFDEVGEAVKKKICPLQSVLLKLF